MTDRRPPDSTLISTASQSALEALKQLEVPLVVLVGGATGTGKSTVATEVAHRLGITRVTSTDVVRQTMRAFFSNEFIPSIHI
jgi:2-phosphoglycerate kinase